MKVRVFLDMAKPIARLEQLASMRHAVPQIRKQSGRNDSSADGINLQCFAESVEIHDFSSGEISNVSAAPGLDTDQAFGMKAVERFADRGFTDAKLAREALLSKAGLFVDVFTKNVVLDACIGKRGEILRSF